MSRRKREVILALPSVTAETVAVAPDDAPVIVSAVVKSCAVTPSLNVYDIGVEVSIVLPIAPLDDPVIFSPLTKVPETLVRVSSGADASAEVSLESNTDCILYTSALPSEISLSVALIPYAPSASADKTLSCLERTVVLVLICTLVLVSVANNLTFAPEPKSVESVIVILPVPSPTILPSVSSII